MGAVLVGMVLAGLMVSGGFVMIGSFMMMIGAFVCHRYVSCQEMNFEVHAYATGDL